MSCYNYLFNKKKICKKIVALSAVVLIIKKVDNVATSSLRCCHIRLPFTGDSVYLRNFGEDFCLWKELVTKSKKFFLWGYKPEALGGFINFRLSYELVPQVHNSIPNQLRRLSKILRFDQKTSRSNSDCHICFSERNVFSQIVIIHCTLCFFLFLVCLKTNNCNWSCTLKIIKCVVS